MGHRTQPLIMNTIRIKRVKLSSAITTLHHLLPDAAEIVTQWSKCVPRVNVCGDVAPPKGDGIRHIKFTAQPTLVTVLGQYMRTVPGSELSIIAEPEFLLSRDGIEKFMESIQSLRPEMGYGAYINVNGKPSAFIVSTPIIAHMIRALPTDLGFSGRWREVVHTFLSNSMRHRYQDISSFGIVQEVAKALPEVVEAPPVPEKRKKGPLRKVKLNA